jgi:ADP-heptose:LPS heptosyltransferase
MVGQIHRARRIKRILLVVDYCHTGDALRIAPYARAVRAHYPSATVTLLANTHTLPVFQVGGHCDRVVVSRLYDLPNASPWRLRTLQACELVRLAAHLGTGYDLVLTFWWGTPLLHLLGWVTAPHGLRIGYARKLPWLLSSDLGALPGLDPAGEHITLLREAGVEARRLPPSIQMRDADCEVAGQLLRQAGLGSRPFVVLHPGSDWSCQQWLPNRWAALGDELRERFGVDLVFTGSAGEAALVESIRGHMCAASVSLAGQTSLQQLAAVLTRAHLCVCVDCAVYELTQAVGIPAVVLAGPTDPQRIVRGIQLPVIVNPLSPTERSAINACRILHDRDGGCLNDQCPMAGLRQISLAQTLQAVGRQAREAGLSERPVEEVRWAQ